MYRNPLVYGALTCLLLVLAFATTGVAQRYPVPVGAKHPDFRLPDVQDGQPLSLGDYRGKKVVLIHFASW